MKPTLTLVVCSNREGVVYPNIWKEVLRDARLAKIVLVTQGSANSYTNHQSKVVHIKLTNTGRSRAINRGLDEVHTELVGLTDDDCYLDKDWVSKAVVTLSDPLIALVYGQTHAYHPEEHTGQICPCTFTKKPNKFTVTSHISRHWIDVGYDNNAVIKKQVFDAIGRYKWWLGPGSIGHNAEDAEFILRALIARHTIAYNPSMIVYHNKWLTIAEAKHQAHSYLCGGIAAYGFYGLLGVSECREVMQSYIAETFQGITDEMKALIHARRSPPGFLYDVFADLYHVCWGLLIAFFFAKITPIPPVENVVKNN